MFRTSSNVAVIQGYILAYNYEKNREITVII